MLLVPIIILICLVIGIACIVYAKRKERELIEQVTPITRGEWSERKVVLKLLKWVLTQEPYSMTCIFRNRMVNIRK